MEYLECLACGELFQPRPQNPTQTYCTKTACQRERRRRWQQIKRNTDPDYINNQLHAQHAWMARNPGYWRAYRSLHPQYAEGNRAMQLVRNYKNRSSMIAKMDASNSVKAAPTGLYRMILLPHPLIAKKNAWNVFLSLLPEPKFAQHI